MSRCYYACLTVFVLMSAANAETPKKSPPKLKGRWQLVVMNQDEVAAPDKFLKGAHLDVTDDLMVFHVPSKPKYPDLHIKYEFVPGGINMQISDSDELDYNGNTFYGAWSEKNGRFRFAFFNQDGVKVRPPLTPAKSVTYIELRRQKETSEK